MQGKKNNNSGGKKNNNNNAAHLDPKFMSIGNHNYYPNQLNVKTNIIFKLKNMMPNNSNNNNKEDDKQIKENKKEIEKKKKLEEMKKEQELEEQIRDSLKCYICLSKVTKPKMCNFCKRICCEVCINKWLENHSFCGICKRHITAQDMITLPFLDDMSQFFINNIDNQHKKNMINYKQQSKDINKNVKPLNNINNNMNNITEVSEGTEFTPRNDSICQQHGNKIDYYCVQCNKYFCSQCLIFFGTEKDKHKDHLIVQISKLDDLGVNQALDEYTKLPETKNEINKLLGLCNFKKREDKIKKYEIINFMKLIKDLYIKKIDDETNELKASLENAKQQKIQIENNINSFSSEINKLLSNNNNNQNNNINQQQILRSLKIMNNLNKNLNRDLEEKSKRSLKLFVENYQTDFYEIPIQNLNHINNGAKLMNYTLNNIPNYPYDLITIHNNNKIIISINVTIKDPINSPNYPTFYASIFFKSNDYGLEFVNLNHQNIPQNQAAVNKIQINNIELDIEKFQYLLNNEGKINMKILILKTFYK